MRRIIEFYRYITIAAFVISGIIIAFPVVVFFLPGYHGQLASGIGLLGMAMLIGVFASSGMSVIGISIYDQVKETTTQIEWLRSDLAGAREGRNADN